MFNIKYKYNLLFKYIKRNQQAEGIDKLVVVDKMVEDEEYRITKNFYKRYNFL